MKTVEGFCSISLKPPNISEETYRSYIKLSSEAPSEANGRLKDIFSPEQLSILKQYLSEVNDKFFGMTKVQCKRLIYEFAERTGIDHPFNRETRMATEEWFNAFTKEFEFTLRPNESSLSRGTACSQKDIDDFFRTLIDLRKKYDFRPEKIFHADEICVSAVPNDLTRFTASSQTPKKGIGRMLVETRDNVTLVCCASAFGTYIPPMIVFPRDKMIPGFLRGLPSGSIGYTSEKGLINSELFLTFLKHFIQHSMPSISSPVLLLIDNYISYISLEAIDFCKEHHVVVMGFPPHSRHKLQPLDLSFFRPLKACYSHACDGFSDAYPRVKLTVDNVGEVFRTAYCRTATPENAIKGFEESGIEPLRPQLYCSSTITAPKEPEVNEVLENVMELTAASLEEDSDVEIVFWPEEPKVGEKRDILEGTPEGDGESIACLRCSGLFQGKDWVQCLVCKQWWHRDCKGYHKGVHCDYCKDSIKGLDNSC